MLHTLSRRHVLAALGAIAALPAAAQPRSVTHAQGELSLPGVPQRVVVFDIAALDMLDALGVEQIVGVAGNTFPAHLARYAEARYPKLGTLFEPNYEAVNAARPDLVIVGGRSGAKYPDLAKMAPTVAMFGTNGNDEIARVIRNTELLGRIFGREAKAAELVGTLKDASAKAAAAAQGRGRGLLVLTVGTRMSAFGLGSRFGILHSDFGVTPAVEGLSTATHGQSVNSEFILQANPDWLFVLDRDAAIGRGGSAQKLLDNPLVQQTKAWQNKQVVYLDPMNWYIAIGGIQTTTKMAEQIAAAFARA